MSKDFIEKSESGAGTALTADELLHIAERITEKYVEALKELA